MVKQIDSSQIRKHTPKRIFIGLFIANMAAMLGMGILLPIFAPYAKSLGASGLLLGLVFAGFALGRGLLSPVFGQISDKYGRKKIMLIGLLLYGILPIGYILTHNVWVLAVLWFFQGISSAMVSPIAQSYIGDVTPKGKEGRVMNLFYIGQFGGVAIGPIIGGFLAEKYSISAPFLFMAGAAILAFFLILFAIPEIKNSKVKTRPSFKSSLKAVWGDHQMKGVLYYLFGRGFYRWGFNTFFPIYVIALAGLSKSQVGILVSSYMIAGTVLQYPCGFLTDRYAKRQPELIAIGGVLAALPMFLVPVFQSMLALSILVIFMGAISALPRATTVAIRTERGRKYGMGIASGVYLTSISMGQVLGPVSFGGVSDLLNIPAAFYVGGVSGLLTTGIAYWYLRIKPKRTAAHRSVR